MKIVEPIRNKKTIEKIEQNLLLKENKRDLLLFIFGINTGLRISDILALDVKDVRNKDYLSICEQKTGKYKKFPLNKKLKRYIKQNIAGRNANEPLFITIYNNRMERTYAYKVLKNICRENKVKESIGTHSLRKTFGYHHYKQYKDVALLQKIFNHNSPSITLRYIGLEQEEINKSYLNFEL